MAGCLSIFLVASGCAVRPDLDRSLNSIVKPYRFSIARWELNSLLSGGSSRSADEDTGAVKEYFTLVEEIKALESEIEAAGAEGGEGNPGLPEVELERLQQKREALARDVEAVLSRQIKEILAEKGIYNAFYRYVGLKVNLPPVSFRLEKPPKLLVVSPRDRIESLREILLKQGLSLEEMEAIEARADELGVSSLVVGLGGLGATYPSFVDAFASLRYTIDTAIHEWLHQYLVLTPLGFSYLLDLTGLQRNYEVATLNETLVSMVSKEIRSTLCGRYYPECQAAEAEEKAGSGFDFNAEMREIRKAVDDYLARGEIEEAERFMEQKRQYLASKGYYIRKLNQAYFAFYGTYADQPTSISPIGRELKELRDRSASLRDFLDTASGVTSRGQLKEAIKRLQP